MSKKISRIAIFLHLDDLVLALLLNKDRVDNDLSGRLVTRE